MSGSPFLTIQAGQGAQYIVDDSASTQVLELGGAEPFDRECGHYISNKLIIKQPIRI